ncbi:DUF4179 domain-containing protein [Clostridium estertheticum]|uniref:DUF4179 domain-containing protein n=1 Tax=Clostridium estertheticum TaxID=238834 RepID=UPI0013EE84F1|nr:DUF4179 domain-containing protein [Clostridium estertheticum]MBZ9606321.1 DUF4179 domain-containing protein [Clostridium estertheticum]
MKNDIYAVLNEADINLDDYKKENFNDIEKKNIKDNFRKSINKKKFYNRKIVAAVAVVALTVGILGSNVPVAGLSTFSSNIGAFLGIQENLDEYNTVVNKTITDNGVTVKLNEVILDGDELNVSYNISSNKKLEKNQSWFCLNDIYVNGKSVNGGAGGGAFNVDDYTTQTVMAYDLGKVDVSGDLNIKISSHTMNLNDKETKGSWDFNFKTNGDQLKINTKEILLNKKFSLPNGEEYTLKKYTSNAVGQKIYASISNFTAKSTYAVDLKGIDDLGNKVTFYASHSDKEGALFKIENIDGNLNKNAKTLTLTPYAAKYPDKSGRMDGESKQVGDKFTIDLSQLK